VTEQGGQTNRLRNDQIGATERFARGASEWTGSTSAFMSALAVMLAWLAVGPFVGFSDTWQLTINTVTSVATFMMVFLIQRAQNKDALAIQLKLSEVVAALHGASNQLISIEELSEQDLRRLHARFTELSKRAVGDAPTSVQRATDTPEPRE
jgi:low affinity Fe/Cu permease